MTKDEKELIRKFLQSSPSKALRLLYDKFYKPLLRVSLSFTKDDLVADDIVQEAFISLWKNRDALKEDHAAPLHHYLVRIVKLNSMKHFNAQVKSEELTKQYLSDTPFETQHPSREVKLIEEETNKIVNDILLTFPPQEKRCLQLRYLEEMTVSEIAIELNISVSGVEARLTSGRKRLRLFEGLVS